MLAPIYCCGVSNASLCEEVAPAGRTAEGHNYLVVAVISLKEETGSC